MDSLTLRFGNNGRSLMDQRFLIMTKSGRGGSSPLPVPPVLYPRTADRGSQARPKCCLGNQVVLFYEIRVKRGDDLSLQKTTIFRYMCTKMQQKTKKE